MITIKNKKEIEVLRIGGQKLAVILDKLTKLVKPGISTSELEKQACNLIKEVGGRPSFKGYASILDAKPFPTALCTSINDELVHAPAFPGRELKNGDIISIDVGMEYPFKKGINGYYTDMASTLGVGKINAQTTRLINITKKSLELSIEKVKPGNTLNDIGETIQKYVESQGMSVVRELVGHGVGYDVHEEPQVPNYSMKEFGYEDVVLKPGMVIAIEPMVNIGDWKIKTGKDDFTVLTADKSLCAHFEHTVAVTDNGHLVITDL